MARRVFFSFHYEQDNWRAAKVRNSGVIDGNAAVSDNDWETITGGGDSAIRKWINDQIYSRSCTVVLIGTATAGRKWIDYEIQKTWDDSKGIVGVYIHNLLDRNLHQSPKGSNPFASFTVNGTALSNIVRAYDPPYNKSQDAYNYIKDNLAGWVEEAIRIRQGW